MVFFNAVSSSPIFISLPEPPVRLLQLPDLLVPLSQPLPLIATPTGLKANSGRHILARPGEEVDVFGRDEALGIDGGNCSAIRNEGREWDLSCRSGVDRGYGVRSSDASSSGP